MKIVRKWYWFLSGFIRKYALSILAGILIGTGLVVYGGKLIRLIPVKRTTHIGRVGAYTLSQLPLDIQQKISRGLTTIGPNGEPKLDIAKSMTISDDGTTYTFTLNEKLQWSSSEPFNATQIDLSLNDVVIEKKNDTITFKLKEPFAPFPSILSQPLMRKELVGFPFKKTKIIGLNDFSIENIKIQNQLLRTLTLVSKKEVLIYSFFPTEEEAVTAFKLGKIDRIELLTSPYLENWPNVTITKNEDGNRYLALFFNTADPTLQDKTFRQMLIYATPKATDTSRIISPIHKNSWVYNPQVKPYLHSEETAQNMFDKLKTANPQTNTNLEMTTTPAYAEAAEKIVSAWKAIGLNARLKIVSFPDTNDYQILLIGQQIPDDPDQYSLWHSTQNTNITHYKNPKIDKLLEDGRKERDREKRKQIYQDFQRFLVEDSPAAFLNDLPTFTLERT